MGQGKIGKLNVISWGGLRSFSFGLSNSFNGMYAVIYWGLQRSIGAGG